ncbi:MAG: hypothetical protein LBT79_02825 [Elusimicrobiota bacterium]|nr:hypothetical protein [Elusimicrobiota bacterium]
MSIFIAYVGKGANGKERNYNFVPSMYGRKEFGLFMKSNLKEKNILYVKSKSPQTLIQLQLPSVFEDFGANIQTKSDIVKQNEATGQVKTRINNDTANRQFKQADIWLKFPCIYKDIKR